MSGTKGLALGPNGLCGVATLASGSVEIPLPRPYSLNHSLIATRRTDGTGTPGFLTVAPTVGNTTRTSITVSSSEATDDGEVNWAVCEAR